MTLGCDTECPFCLKMLPLYLEFNTLQSPCFVFSFVSLANIQNALTKMWLCVILVFSLEVHGVLGMFEFISKSEKHLVRLVFPLYKDSLSFPAAW